MSLGLVVRRQLYSIGRCVTKRSFHRNSAMMTSFSRFPVPDVNSLPDDLQEVIKTTTEKSGFSPNVFTALSYRPEELRAFLQYYDAVMTNTRGNLTKADKEMIIVATSSENKCLYCIIAHGALHRIFSKNPHLADQIAANWRTADLDGRQKAILDVAMDLCRCQPLSDQKIEKLREHGLDMDDLWDIGAVTSLFALSNRMAYVMDLKPNQEFYMLGRVPKSGS